MQSKHASHNTRERAPLRAPPQALPPLSATNARVGFSLNAHGPACARGQACGARCGALGGAAGGVGGGGGGFYEATKASPPRRRRRLRAGGDGGRGDGGRACEGVRGRERQGFELHSAGCLASGLTRQDDGAGGRCFGSACDSPAGGRAMTWRLKGSRQGGRVLIVVGEGCRGETPPASGRAVQWRWEGSRV